jgi:MOSC domain-containing protein YiiM
MRLVSVNIGQEQALSHAKASGKTGIYKRHISTPVPVTAAGLQGDVICDTKNHGGVDQAVYVYGVPDYQWWSQELGHDVAPGTFGENLTVTDLESAEVSIGDRLRIGPVVLEVTAPRIPCVTLARRMDDPAFLKRFRAAERPGVYCRVLREGTVQVGDVVGYEPYAGESLTARALFRDFFAPPQDVATLRRQLAAPIAIRARVEKEQQLRELLASEGALRST